MISYNSLTMDIPEYRGLRDAPLFITKESHPLNIQISFFPTPSRLSAEVSFRVSVSHYAVL